MNTTAATTPTAATATTTTTSTAATPTAATTATATTTIATVGLMMHEQLVMKSCCCGLCCRCCCICFGCLIPSVLLWLRLLVVVNGSNLVAVDDGEISSLVVFDNSNNCYLYV